jgi:hypothetical protein
MKVQKISLLILLISFPINILAEKNMDQTINVLSNEQQSEVNEWVELGMDVMAHYGVDQSKSIYENLDMVYESWFLDKRDKPSKDAVIIGLGSVFGDRLNKKHGTEWKMVTDQYGSDFAIILKSGHQIYPIDFVAKRVHGEGDEFGFFSGMDEVIDNDFK